jgi:HrpA-like RNA helicase
MSLRTAAMANENRVALDMLNARVDKLAKTVNLLLKSLAAIEREGRTTSSGAEVPHVKLPDSLANLEIGQNPKGA